MTRLRIPGHVHVSTTPHGGGVILDIRGGQWYALNATGLLLCQELSRTEDFDAAVRAIELSYPSVPRERIRTDAESLAQVLTARRLVDRERHIESWPAKPSAGEPRMARELVDSGRRGGARLAVALAVLLTKLPMAGTVRILSFGRRLWCRHDASLPELAHAVMAVEQVSRRYPGRMACLELSLAAVVAVALRRGRAELVMGIAVDPYRFHAWVEADGVPVLAESDPGFAEYRPVAKL